jgi:hypothetical protein
LRYRVINSWSQYYLIVTGKNQDMSEPHRRLHFTK